VLAVVLGERSWPRHRLCSIRSILRSKINVLPFQRKYLTQPSPVRPHSRKMLEDLLEPRSEYSAIERETNRLSCLSTVGLCLFRIGERSIRSLSSASDMIPCKTKSKLRTVFPRARSPLLFG